MRGVVFLGERVMLSGTEFQPLGTEARRDDRQTTGKGFEDLQPRAVLRANFLVLEAPGVGVWDVHRAHSDLERGYFLARLS